MINYSINVKSLRIAQNFLLGKLYGNIAKFYHIVNQLFNR